jgi:hypothetical protein
MTATDRRLSAGRILVGFIGTIAFCGRRGRVGWSPSSNMWAVPSEVNWISPLVSDTYHKPAYSKLAHNKLAYDINHDSLCPRRRPR